MAMVGVDDSSLQAASCPRRLAWFIRWTW